MPSSVHRESDVPVDSERTVIREGEIFAVPTPDLHPILTAPQDAPAVHELVGQDLDHYRIESLVGIGGMGAVFRGRDSRLDRVVAIKVVPMSHRRADSLRRFRIEAQSAAKLDHPNIARVFYVGETDRWSYIVFEFIEGTNLRQLVLERGPLSVDDATRLTCQVAEALQHACERGVVHRDIKPSNILIGLDGQAKIVDMGLARTTELDRSTGDLTASGVTLGTFDYISPEQAHDPRDADVRSDIYSLGCTLYFLLTGQPPFPDGTALQKLLLHGTRMPEDPRCFRNDVSDTLIAILRKMMAKKPKDRYQEPVDLVNDLRTLATMDSFEWKQEIPDTTVRPHPAGRSWWEFFLPAFICFGGIGLVTLWLYNDDQRSGVYVIPRVEVMEASDVAADDSNPLEPPDEITPPSLSIIPDTSREAAPLRSPSSRMIVVRTSGSPPLDVPASTDTARTLEEAIARWESDPNIERIVIAASSLRLPKTLSIGGSSSNRPLIIEGTQTRRPLLLVGDALGRVPSEAPSSWLLLDAGSVELRGVDIDATYDSFDGAPPALFQVSSGSRLSIFDTTITLKSASKGRLPALFCFKSPANTPPGASALQIERSAIRGQVDVVRIESNDRIELDWKEAWCAAAGSFIDLEGTKTIHRSPRIRAELNHVTSITLNPWIRVRMAATNPFPVPFVRTANDSIFSGSQTLVEWDASNVVEWPFSEQANRVEDLGRWIDLRGMDNVYDVPTIMRLLQVIMSMSSEEVSIDSDSNLLRNERGMELLAAWRTPPTWEPARLHTMTPDATPWSHSGLNPGCRSDQLPPFPVRDDP